MYLNLLDRYYKSIKSGGDFLAGIPESSEQDVLHCKTVLEVFLKSKLGTYPLHSEQIEFSKEEVAELKRLTQKDIHKLRSQLEKDATVKM